MAELNAFVYGWLAGIAAVVIWILYGIDTLLQLMRWVNVAFAHTPGLAHLAEGKAAEEAGMRDRAGSASRSSSHFEKTVASDQGLEGITGNTKRSTPITAAATCMLSWYGPDGTTGAPIECRFSLENNEVTVYQLLRLADSAAGVGGVNGRPGDKLGGSSKSSRRGSSPGAKSKEAQRDTNAFRTAAGVTMVEHRKGKIGVLSTTVMEVRQFNTKKGGNGNGAAEAGGGSKSGGGDLAAQSTSQKLSSHRSRTNTGAPAGPEVGDQWSETVNGSTAGPAKGAKSTDNNGTSSRRGDMTDEVTGAAAMYASPREGEEAGHAAAAVSAGNGGGGGVDSLFTGRVLIWRTMDGSPLFESCGSPSSRSARGGAGGVASPTTMSGNPFARGSMTGSMSATRRGASAPLSTSHAPGFGYPGSGHRPGGLGAAAGSFDARSARSSCENGDASDDGSVTEDAGGEEDCDSGGYAASPKRSHARRAKRREPQWQALMGDMANWSCVIIKFERSRESERWLTLLSGLREARAWHDYAKTMPNPDTINTFLSRFFFQNMRLNGLSDALIKQIRKKLRELPSKKFPRDLGGDLLLDDFLIGTQIPWITDVSEPTVSANGEVGFDFNLLYKGGEGGFTLFFRLALTYRGIRIPHVVFSVKLLELEATVHISIGPPPSKKFWIGGHKPPILRLEVHQGCASGKGVLHRVLTALPDLSGILTNLIKLYLFSDMVLPYMDDFPLPSVVKSPKSSFKDLRVRTFDWKRAAKISGAPAERRGSAAESSEGDHRSSASRAKERRSSGDSGSPLNTTRGSLSSEAASSAARRRPSRVPAGDAADNTAGEATAADAGPLGNSTRAADRRDSDSVPTGSALSVCSPLKVATSSSYARTASKGAHGSSGGGNGGGAPAVPSHRPSLCGTAADGNGRGSLPFTLPTERSNSLSDSAPSNRVSTSALDETLYADSTNIVSDSDGVFSSASKKGSGTSGAMRNLRDLLKLKGKDMTRESVSRSKKKA